MARRHCFVAVVMSALALLLGVRATAASQLTPQERRGKQIYLKGVSSSGPAITAVIGDGQSELPGAVLPCVNCHGYGGLGRPEGGVKPSNITGEALTKPYGVTHESGREHPSYNEATLARAIREGLDPAGNRLLAAMPRYRMPPGDLADLIAYVKSLGREPQPGLTDTSIRVGTVIPASGPLAEIGEDMRSVLAAQLSEVNQQGGIYNRKIELRVLRLPKTASEPETTRGVPEEEVFALVGGVMAGAEERLETFTGTEEIPLIGPVTLTPQADSSANRFAFYLFSGLREQAWVLAAFAAQRLPQQELRAAIVYPESDGARKLAKAIEDKCRNSGWVSTASLAYPKDHFDAARLTVELQRSGAAAVFFLGTSAELPNFLRDAAKLSWTPTVFVPGSLAGRETLEIPLNFKARVFLAFPTLPVDAASESAREYRTLLQKHNLRVQHPAFKLWAYVAGEILIEGLRQAGRTLTREKLVNALEGLYEFRTGLAPPISFGPNRRIGALSRTFSP